MSFLYDVTLLALPDILYILDTEYVKATTAGGGNLDCLLTGFILCSVADVKCYRMTSLQADHAPEATTLISYLMTKHDGEQSTMSCDVGDVWLSRVVGCKTTTNNTRNHFSYIHVHTPHNRGSWKTGQGTSTCIDSLNRHAHHDEHICRDDR